MTQMHQALLKSPNPNADAAPVSLERELSPFVRAKFALVRCFLWGWARLFSLKGLYLLGQVFGTLEYLINFKRRSRFRQALRQVYPEGLEDSRVRALTRGYFCRTRCDKIFYLVFDKLPQEKILHRIRCQGREFVDESLQRGNGLYLMISHNGSHHVLGQLMALMGYQVAGLRDRNEGAVRIYVQKKMSETFPLIAQNLKIYFSDSFPRLIYRHFQNNMLLGSALDVGRARGETLKTCPVRIFRETREFLTGTLQIALRCRAVIGQLFIVSRPNFYFRLIFKPLFTPPPETTENLDTPERVAELMQRYADGIEAHVREHPDHLSRI